MDTVDEMRSKGMVDDAVNCLRGLLEQQMHSMGIRPTETEKLDMAREQLLLAYVDVARFFHASETGNLTDALKAKGDAEQRLSEMRDKLQRG